MHDYKENWISFRISWFCPVLGTVAKNMSYWLPCAWQNIAMHLIKRIINVWLVTENMWIYKLWPVKTISFAWLPVCSNLTYVNFIPYFCKQVSSIPSIQHYALANLMTSIMYFKSLWIFIFSWIKEKFDCIHSCSRRFNGNNYVLLELMSCVKVHLRHTSTLSFE